MKCAYFCRSEILGFRSRLCLAQFHGALWIDESLYLMVRGLVRYLGIFIISLIQKYNISGFVMAYMCMCISLTNNTTCRDDIQMNTVKTKSTVITEIRLYPAEGPMPRASEAPFALVDIVRCSKSRTTIGAGRCSQCSPTNGSPGRRRLAVPKAITGKKTGSESDHHQEEGVHR